jgi:hypothetical protein
MYRGATLFAATDVRGICVTGGVAKPSVVDAAYAFVAEPSLLRSKRRNLVALA